MLFIYCNKTCKGTFNKCFPQQVTNIKLNAVIPPSKISLCSSLNSISPFLALSEWEVSLKLIYMSLVKSS